MQSILPMGSGVYAITCNIDGKIYVGASRNMRRRAQSHRSAILAGKHHSAHLQCAVGKYGLDVFSFSVLELCDPESLVTREEFWMTYYRSREREFGYNSYPANGTHSPFQLSEETKARRAQEPLCRVMSEEARRRMSVSNMGNQSHLGHKHSEESKAKMSAATKAKWQALSDEQRKRWIAAAAEGMKGHGCSAETKCRLSEVMKKRPPNPDRVAKMAVTKRGTHRSEETKVKISAAHMGRPKSAETRAKMSRPKSAETRAKMSANWYRSRGLPQPEARTSQGSLTC